MGIDGRIDEKMDGRTSRNKKTIGRKIVMRIDRENR